jgi:hypothetical protein
MRRIPPYALAIASTLAMAAPARAADVLPNLVQMAPSELSVDRDFVRGRYAFHLGFRSATENWGPGPLTVRGTRKSGTVPTMRVQQLVAQDGGGTRTVGGIGVMRYVVHRDHQHWHYLRFASYEVRRLSAGRRARRRDRKTGFCLGDRYQAPGGERMPGFGAFPPHTGRCGLRRPDLLEMIEGITPGWGDDYHAHIEGQFVDITGFPAGRYLLLHRANPTGALVETDTRDNAASAVLRLSWPRGHKRRPRIRVLRRCGARAGCAALR